MPGDAGTGRSPGAGRSFLPPVFTHWSDRPAGAPAAPKPEPVASAPDADGTFLPEFLKKEAVSTLVAVDAEPLAPERGPRSFPVDAFLLPEEAQHRPTGIAASASPATLLERIERAPVDGSAKGLAERLERLARRLRTEGAAGLASNLTGGDRLDALLAGLVAGYLAARNE